MPPPRRFKRGARGDEGATLVEYALLCGLIGVVVVLVLTAIGTRLSNIFGSVEVVIEAAQD